MAYIMPGLRIVSASYSHILSFSHVHKSRESLFIQEKGPVNCVKGCQSPWLNDTDIYVALWFVLYNPLNGTVMYADILWPDN